MRRVSILVSVALLAIAIALVAPSPAGAATPRSVTYSHAPIPNPPGNESPLMYKAGSGCYTNEGYASPYSSTCTAVYINALDASIVQDGYHATIELPSNWGLPLSRGGLSEPLQQFVLLNLIRQAYNIQPFYGVNAALTAEAQDGANAGNDGSPTDPNWTTWNNEVNAAGQYEEAGSGYWAGGTLVLGDLWYMLYADGCGPQSNGWGGNQDCPASGGTNTSPGSWGHRDGMLEDVIPQQEDQTSTYYYGSAEGASGTPGYDSINATWTAVSGTPSQQTTPIPVTFKWSQEQKYLPSCEQNGVDTCTLLPPCVPNVTTGAIIVNAFCTAPATSPVVGMATVPGGYYQVTANGAVYAYGKAVNYGSMAGKPLNKPIVGMAVAPSGGYYLVASDGGIFAFGPKSNPPPFHGSMGGRPLNKPIVGIATTPGGGYYEVASDGGLFAFGPGTPFHGSMGGRPLNKPVVGMTTTPGGGYYEVASDGGIFAFGPGTPFYGSMGGKWLNKPVVGMTTTPGGGYYMVASDGGLFAFGPGTPFLGSMGGQPLNKPVVGMTEVSGGYYEVASDGGLFSFGTAPYLGSANNPTNVAPTPAS
ncbi:MAG: hypothetical protein ACYDEP_02825 [Acidimicrobiales bacterium]